MNSQKNSKLSPGDITGQEPGKVGLKGILKGGSPHLRPASMDGFQVADFHRDTQSRVRKEESVQAEIQKLENQLAQAKGEIARLQDQMTKDVQSARGQGFQEGHFKGVAEGEKNAEELWQAQLDVIRKDVTENLERIATQQQQLYKDLQDASVELALGLTQRLFLTHAEHNEELISHVISEALQYLGQEEKLRIRVNPLDLTLAEKGGTFWKPLASNLQNVELVPDPRLERGGCLLESEKGSSIDMRTQTLLQNLADAVRSAYQQFQAGK